MIGSADLKSGLTESHGVTSSRGVLLVAAIARVTIAVADESLVDLARIDAHTVRLNMAFGEIARQEGQRNTARTAFDAATKSARSHAAAGFTSPGILAIYVKPVIAIVDLEKERNNDRAALEALTSATAFLRTLPVALTTNARSASEGFARLSVEQGALHEELGGRGCRGRRLSRCPDRAGQHGCPA